MAFPADPLGVTIKLAFGADRTAAPDTWDWTDVTDRWHVDEELEWRPSGRRDGARQAEAGKLSLALRNTDGQLTPEDPRSQWWPHVDEGLPIRLTLDPQLPSGATLEFGGFVNSLRPEWPGGSGHLAIVTITASGVLRQTGRGSRPLRNALRRHVDQHADAVVAYWPMDDADTEARPVYGPVPLRPSDSENVIEGEDGPVQLHPTWAAATLASWLGPGVLLDYQPVVIDSDLDLYVWQGLAFRAKVAAGIRGEWAVDWLAWARALGLSMTLSVGVLPGVGAGSGLQISSDANNGIFTVQTFTDGAVDETWTPSVPHTLQDNALHHLRLHAVDSGGWLQWMLYLDGVEVASETSTAVGIPQLEDVFVFGPAGGARDREILMGQMVVWADGVPPIAASVAAARAHEGERAGHRFLRLTAEENLSGEVVGDPDDTMPMGRQLSDSFVTLLRQCEAADDGILAEGDGHGYRLRTRRSRYNQTPTLVIDAANRELGRDFSPTADDQRRRNEWVVERIGGGDVTARDEADQQRRGVREETLRLSLAWDQQLPDRAGWELSRSTVGGLRYPRLEVPLHAAPQLVEQVMAVQQGDRVQVVNPPRQHPPGPVDQVVAGMIHRIRGRRWWTWQAVVAPAAPWTVGQWAGTAETPDPDAPQRYDTAGSETVGSFESGTDTELVVATTLGDLWTTDADDLPLDIRCAGVRLRVTAISGSSSPQTFTTPLTPVNGVEKTIPAGTAVSLWQPARWAL